jgi:acetone carboxylase gamma subunit
MLLQITEYLDIDLVEERWRCNRCGHDLGDARESYKKGCLVRDRDPREVHFPIGPSKEFNFSLDPKWMRIVEFYCPSCAVMVENEYLPPGHPLTWDIQLDLDKLQQKHGVTSIRTGHAAGRTATRSLRSQDPARRGGAQSKPLHARPSGAAKGVGRRVQPGKPR